MTAAGRNGGASAPPSRPWWLGVAVIAIGAVWLYEARTLPQMAQYAVVGPGLFVTLVGAGLVLLGVLLLAQIARGERFEPQEAEDADARRSADWRALGTTLVAAAVPLVTIRRLGFAATASLVFAIVARAFGSRRLLVDLVIGLVIGTLAWFLFSRLLGVELPGFLPGLR